LRGIFHAAGLLDDALLAGQDGERLRRVMRPKVLGAWNLHRLSAQLSLDAFVLYSSVASVMGSPGQANYAAANAFLDALAHHRRARGLPALAVAWGSIADVGLAAADERRGARLAARGMKPLGLDRAHTLLARLLIDGTTTVAVAPFDARQWVEFYPALAASSLFGELLSAAATAQTPGRGAMKDAVVAAAAVGERAAVMESLLQAEVARVLRLDAARVARTSNLMTLGLDSLIGLELRNRLETGLGVKLPSTLVWTYPRLDALAAHLVTLLPAPPSPAMPVAEEARALAELSDEALLSLLAAELAGGEPEPGEA
jgi:acyl carrier protein